MALPVIVLALAAAGLTVLVLYLQDLNKWVDHTDVVIGRAYQLQKLTAERETALRGYVLSRDPLFLDRFNATDAQMSPLFDELQDLVADAPEQVERLRAARVEVIRYRHHAAQQVDRIRDGANADQVAFTLRRGNEIGQDIRAPLQAFVRNEEGVRALRVRHADVITWYALMTGIILSLLVGTGVAFATARQMRLVREKYTEALDEQKRAESSLRESEEQLRLAKDAAGMGSWNWNLATGDLVWSDRCKALFAIDPAVTMSYEVFQAAVHPDDRDRVDAAVNAALANGIDYDVEMRVPWPDGSVHWVAAKGRAFHDEEGHAIRMAGMTLDITERKRAEHALAEAARRKDEFLGALSHELRNPLAPIRNSVYVLAHADPSGEQARRARSVIERQVDHMTRLVEDLLDVKRLSVGKMRLRTERIDLVKPVRDMVEDLRALFVERRLALHVRVPDVAVWIDGDPTRIAQVIGNLLQNAVKFTDPGGHVAIAVEARGDRAHVVVRDDGVGMAPDLIDSLFDPFVQAERTLDRSHGGLGLGLALVRGIVELHGGSVVVRSEGIGKGTEFDVSLPASSVTPEAAAEQRPAPARASRRVLVIEDNDDAAASLRDLLELEGHEVHVAADGASGVDAARTLDPDVILCDIGLPVLDGYAVARHLRADGVARRAKLVALTGYASPDDVERCRDAGFDTHVAKPPDVETLLRLISQSAAGPRAAA